MRIAFIVLTLAACVEDSLQPPTGEIARYKVDEQRFPVTNTEARELGLDLNGDNTIDNQLGMVFSTLIYQDADPRTTKLMTGEVVQLIDVQYASESDPNDSVAFTLSDGSATVPNPLLGERTNGPMMLGPGALTVTFGFFDDVVQLELLEARVSLDMIDATQLRARVGGGVSPAAIATKLVPPFVRFLETVVARDCTNRNDPAGGCGCVSRPSGTDGKTWLNLFEASATRDCVITIEEVLKSSYVISFTAPDVTIDGDTLLSFGFGIHATAL